MFGTWLLATVIGAGGVKWENEFDAAFVLARERAVPVLIAFNMDHESANDALVKVYRDADFAKNAGECVCLIASAFNHEPTTDGHCSRFDGITCAEHQAVEKKARKTFLGTEEAIAPQHMLVTAEKKILSRRAFAIDATGLTKLIKMAVRALRSGDSAEVSHGAERGDVIAPGVPTGSQIAELIEKAKDRNAETRSAAILELGRIDDLRARDALIGLLDPKSMDATRAEAIAALATRGNFDALVPITARLKDTNTIVVRAAIRGLGKLGLPGGSKALLDLGKKKLLTMVASEIPFALAECDPKAPEVRMFIEKACANKDDAIAIGGMRALAKLDATPSTVKILRGKLGDSSTNVRGAAVWAIGTLREASLGEDLRSLSLKETSLDVRQCITAALRNISSTAKDPFDPELDGLLAKFHSDGS